MQHTNKIYTNTSLSHLRRIFFTTLLAVSTLTLSGAPAYAQERHKAVPPWGKPCAEFNTAQQFVRESTLYCLRQQNQRVCHERAQEFFEGCRFSGDYQRMSSIIHTKMLMVLALAGSRSTTSGSAS